MKYVLTTHCDLAGWTVTIRHDGEEHRFFNYYLRYCLFAASSFIAEKERQGGNA